MYYLRFQSVLLVDRFNKTAGLVVIIIDPNYVAAYNNQGAVLTELGRTKETTGAYNKAVALNPALVEKPK